MESLNCPCCGGKSGISKEYYTQNRDEHVSIYCTVCGLSTIFYDNRWENGIKNATNAWNKRAK